MSEENIKLLKKSRIKNHRASFDDSCFNAKTQ